VEAGELDVDVMIAISMAAVTCGKNAILRVFRAFHLFQLHTDALTSM
jgi:hypothetical protein